MAKIKIFDRELYYDTTDDGIYELRPDGTYQKTHIGGATLVTDASTKSGPIYVDATYEYYGKTFTLNAALDDPVWQVRRMRLSDSYIQFADGDAEYNNVFTSLAVVAALTFV